MFDFQQPLQKQRLPKLLAFTLMELLIVVALVAILAALLFPVVEKLVSQARITTIFQNARQLATGGIQYAAEHAGNFPTTDWGAQPEEAIRWVDAVVPYVYETVHTNSDNQTMVDGVFRCPGLGGYGKRGKTWYRWDWNEVDWMNFHEAYPPDGVRRYRINSFIITPSKVPWLVTTDRNNGTSGLFGWEQSWFDQYVPPAVWKYRGGILAIYADGHTEIVPEPTLDKLFKR